MIMKNFNKYQYFFIIPHLQNHTVSVLFEAKFFQFSNLSFCVNILSPKDISWTTTRFKALIKKDNLDNEILFSLILMLILNTVLFQKAKHRRELKLFPYHFLF